MLSLGVGMAGVAVVFGLADAYLLRHPPGLADPARLAEVGRLRLAGGDPGEDPGFNTFSYPNFRDYRERQTVFDGLAAYHLGGLARFGFGTGREAVPVLGAYVSANYFDVLGVPMARGRGFSADDERLDQARTVVVISHQLWQAQFNGAHDVDRAPVRLNGRPFTVIGVASPRLRRLRARGTAVVGAAHGISGWRRLEAGRIAGTSMADGDWPPEARRRARAGARPDGAHRRRPGARVS